MHRTVEAIIYPDGTIEALENIEATAPRRALLTILDESPLPLPSQPQDDDEDARSEQLLWDAGLLVVPEDISAALVPLSEQERAALARRIPAGTPVSQIIIEDRDERF